MKRILIASAVAFAAGDKHSLPIFRRHGPAAARASDVCPAVPLYNWTGFYIGGNLGWLEQW